MRKIMKTTYENNNTMQISLFILVDDHGRIYYTGFSRDTTEDYNNNFLNEKNLQVVELTGSYEKTNTGTET